jgi:endonuclease/exonuclease/phosphatase family metal-dependent hydrolase
MARAGRARILFAVLLGSAAACYALWWVFLLILTLITPKLGTTDVAVNGSCSEGKWPDHVSLVTWNLGYGGNAAEDSFFLDGGREVLAGSKQAVLAHLSRIANFLADHPADMYLLQEVDSGSRRTYYIDERELLSRRLGNICASYARNHDVPFVPYPYLHPLGRIRSGIFSGWIRKPLEAKRYQLPGSFSWPDSAFHLRRCLLLSRFPREHGHDWVVINVHLEAWDDGNIRKQELTFLRDLAVDEYKRGNYVIVAGDWNSVLPGVRIDQYPTKESPGGNVRLLPANIFPADWTWGVDRSRPSNRRTNAPYRLGMTYTTVIDGFAVSPNVHIDAVTTVPLDFRDTDHEPVFMHVVGSTPGSLGHLP